MRYLLDTNVVSELRKGVRCDPAVAAWEQAAPIPHGGALSVLTIGEIRKGIQLIAQRDQQQAARLEIWLTGVPKQANPWQPLLDSLGQFSDDFMEERSRPVEQKRATMFER